MRSSDCGGIDRRNTTQRRSHTRLKNKNIRIKKLSTAKSIIEAAVLFSNPAVAFLACAYETNASAGFEKRIKLQSTNCIHQ
jgi:hypothetical protein